jgi:hypothetical protein
MLAVPGAFGTPLPPLIALSSIVGFDPLSTATPADGALRLPPVSWLFDRVAEALFWNVTAAMVTAGGVPDVAPSIVKPSTTTLEVTAEPAIESVPPETIVPAFWISVVMGAAYAAGHGNIATTAVFHGQEKDAPRMQ